MSETGGDNGRPWVVRIRSEYYAPDEDTPATPFVAENSTLLYESETEETSESSDVTEGTQLPGSPDESGPTREALMDIWTSSRVDALPADSHRPPPVTLRPIHLMRYMDIPIYTLERRSISRSGHPSDSEDCRVLVRRPGFHSTIPLIDIPTVNPRDPELKELANMDELSRNYCSLQPWARNLLLQEYKHMMRFPHRDEIETRDLEEVIGDSMGKYLEKWTASDGATDVETETPAEFKERLFDMVNQMMFVSGETAEPSIETTSAIEEITRQQVVEIVSSVWTACVSSSPHPLTTTTPQMIILTDYFPAHSQYHPRNSPWFPLDLHR